MYYSKTKIYKIWSPQGNKIYIGSTCKNYLSERMSEHRGAYKQYKKNNNKFITSFILFNEYGLENCFIELIEAKECNSKDEKNKLEGYHIRTLECVNKIIPDRKEQEYREDNKEKIKKKKKKYIEHNKEKIKEYQKEYREDNKEKIIEYYKIRISKKITCECGSLFLDCNKIRHLNSIKHTNYLKTL